VEKLRHREGDLRPRLGEGQVRRPKKGKLAGDEKKRLPHRNFVTSATREKIKRGIGQPRG